MLTLLAASLALGPSGWWQKLGPLFEEGIELYGKADYGAAAERFSRAIPVARHACFYNRALCYFKLGNWSLARHDFDNALQSARDTADKRRTMLALAATELRAGRPEQALRWLDRLRRRGPDGAALQIDLAAALAAREEHEAAIAALRRATALLPSFAPTAELWQAILRHQAAQRKQEPTGPFLGIDPATARDRQAAVRSLADALRIQPGFAPARLLLSALRAEALRQGPPELVGRIDALLALDLRTSRADACPLAALDDRPLAGDPPTPSARTWESYAGRWELLVLLAVVAVVLWLYLRLTRQRRLSAPAELAATLRSGRTR